MIFDVREKRAPDYCNVDYLRKTCCGSYGCPIDELLEVKEYCVKGDDIQDMMCQLRYRFVIQYFVILRLATFITKCVK